MKLIFKTTGFYCVNLLPNKRCWILKAFLRSQPNAGIKLYLEQLREISIADSNDIGYYYIYGSGGYWNPGKPLVQTDENSEIAFVVIPMYSKTEPLQYLFVGDWVYIFKCDEKLKHVNNKIVSLTYEFKLNGRNPSRKLLNATRFESMRIRVISNRFSRLRKSSKSIRT